MTLHTAQADIIIAAFPDWVRKQPKGKCYNYSNAGRCAFAQYLTALGFEGVRVGSGCFVTQDMFGRFSPQLADALALAPSTFGALARRLT